MAGPAPSNLYSYRSLYSTPSNYRPAGLPSTYSSVGRVPIPYTPSPPSSSHLYGRTSDGHTRVGSSRSDALDTSVASISDEFSQTKHALELLIGERFPVPGSEEHFNLHRIRFGFGEVPGAPGVLTHLSRVSKSRPVRRGELLRNEQREVLGLTQDFLYHVLQVYYGCSIHTWPTLKDCQVWKTDKVLQSSVLLVLVHGRTTPPQVPGAWSEDLFLFESLAVGSVLPYMALAAEKEYGVLVLDPLGDVSPEDHMRRIYDELLAQSEAKHVLLFGHAEGAQWVLELLKSRPALCSIVSGIALVAAPSYALSLDTLGGVASETVKRLSRHWKPCAQALDEFLETETKRTGFNCVSAGHLQDEYAPASCCMAVFDFFGEAIELHQKSLAAAEAEVYVPVETERNGDPHDAAGSSDDSGPHTDAEDEKTNIMKLNAKSAVTAAATSSSRVILDPSDSSPKEAAASEECKSSDDVLGPVSHVSRKDRGCLVVDEAHIKTLYSHLHGEDAQTSARYRFEVQWSIIVDKLSKTLGISRWTSKNYVCATAAERQAAVRERGNMLHATSFHIQESVGDSHTHTLFLSMVLKAALEGGNGQMLKHFVALTNERLDDLFDEETHRRLRQRGIVIWRMTTRDTSQGQDLVLKQLSADAACSGSQRICGLPSVVDTGWARSNTVDALSGTEVLRSLAPSSLLDVRQTRRDLMGLRSDELDDAVDSDAHSEPVCGTTSDRVQKRKEEMSLAEDKGHSEEAPDKSTRLDTQRTTSPSPSPLPRSETPHENETGTMTGTDAQTRDLLDARSASPVTNGERQAAAQAATKGWPCSKCTYVNAFSEIICSICFRGMRPTGVSSIDSGNAYSWKQSAPYVGSTGASSTSSSFMSRSRNRDTAYTLHKSLDSSSWAKPAPSTSVTPVSTGSSSRGRRSSDTLSEDYYDTRKHPSTPTYGSSVSSRASFLGATSRAAPRISRGDVGSSQRRSSSASRVRPNSVRPSSAPRSRPDWK